MAYLGHYSNTWMGRLRENQKPSVKTAHLLPDLNYFRLVTSFLSLSFHPIHLPPTPEHTVFVNNKL
jgi:hypothetical protein